MTAAEVTARRLRVLTLLDRVGVGGAERFAVGLATGLERDRFEPMICTSRPCPPPSSLGIPGTPVRHLPLARRSTADLAGWRPLIEFARREPVDVLHAHMHGSNVWGAVLGRLLGVPVIVATEHSWSYEGQPLRRALDRDVVARLSSTFVAISEADRTRMERVERIPPERTRLMPLGLVPRGASASSVALRDELRIPEENRVVGVVCSLSPPKALHILLESLAVLRRHRPVDLVIAGDGPLREQLVERTGELGIRPNVHFLGSRSDVSTLLSGFDVFAMSSEREGTPIALLEAMDAGLPAVATAVGGIPDLLADGAGMLTAPGDPEALAAGLERVLSDPTLGADLGRRARERVRRQFGFAATVRAWENLYAELYADSSRRRLAIR